MTWAICFVAFFALIAVLYSLRPFRKYPELREEVRMVGGISFIVIGAWRLWEYRKERRARGK